MALKFGRADFVEIRVGYISYLSTEEKNGIRLFLYLVLDEYSRKALA